MSVWCQLVIVAAVLLGPQEGQCFPVNSEPEKPAAAVNEKKAEEKSTEGASPTLADDKSAADDKSIPQFSVKEDSTSLQQEKKIESQSSDSQTTVPDDKTPGAMPEAESQPKAPETTVRAEDMVKSVNNKDTAEIPSISASDSTPKILEFSVKSEEKKDNKPTSNQDISGIPHAPNIESTQKTTKFLVKSEEKVENVKSVENQATAGIQSKATTKSISEIPKISMKSQEKETAQPVIKQELMEIPTETKLKPEINAHTITSIDFAKKTALVNAQVNAELAATEAAAAANPTAKEKTEDNKPKKTDIPTVKVEETVKPIEDEKPKKVVEDVQAIESLSKSEKGDQKEKEGSVSNSKDQTENVSSEKPKTNDGVTKEESLSEMSTKLSDEFKKYSNDVFICWDKKKEKVSQASEAMDVLREYNYRITIMEEANYKNCVKENREKYDNRMKELEGLMKSCEAGLKRSDWHDLQEKTKEIVNKINEIVQEATDSINKLPKDAADFESSKAAIEHDAKVKLQEINSPSIKATFLKLKDKSLRTDEEDYSKCIKSKTEKGMEVDTRNDITWMKNNCDG